VQITGALVSKLLWGWWGDKSGKASFLRIIAFGLIFPPMAILLSALVGDFNSTWQIQIYILVFFISGALAYGLTITVVGYLMEISPEYLRPAYSC
jgi:MFS family permease